MLSVTMLGIILRKHAASYYVEGYLEKTCCQLLCWGLSLENMLPVTMLRVILRKHAASYYVGDYLEKTCCQLLCWGLS